MKLKMEVLIRIKSHRARYKLESLGVPYVAMFTFREGYFYKIDEGDLDIATSITGINKARKPKGELLKCWPC